MIEQIKTLRDGHTLTSDDMKMVMLEIFSGRIPEALILEFLNTYGDRLPTMEELLGAATALRENMVRINGPYGTVDCCGTGGDQVGTYNISTAVAIVAASCGVPVAKHGNRSASSRTGAADVLEALGVRLDISVPMQEQALKDLNFVFLMAPLHHKGMKYVSSARKKINRKTIFNVMGPLANPAGARRQLVGVYDEKLLILMAEALKKLGSKRAWVVHGAGGLDEISISGPTHISVLDDEGEIHEKEITPEDFGLEESSLEKIKGGDAEENAMAIRALFDGHKTAYRDVVVANTAAVLAVHGSVTDLRQGAKRAEKVLDDGTAKQTLKDYIMMTRLG